MADRKTLEAKSRNDKFVEKASTKICYEIPSDDNPYIPRKRLYHGYDLLELIRKVDYPDIIFLLFQGEFPTEEQRQLLKSLMIALCNPGPRHNATRAAMAASVSKTQVELLLPIGLTVLSGEHLGAGEVQESMLFIKKHRFKEPGVIASRFLEGTEDKNEPSNRIAPGFGSIFNGIDIITSEISAYLKSISPVGRSLNWALDFADRLKPHGYGILPTGMAAATFMDLGFGLREAPGLFQLFSAPGILAHAVEMSGKPITAMPFVSDKNYIIDRDE